ncbi:UvrD-helicase domain-containing protein [Hanstruepera marina]|uniref:UvrD-helicase domain-containing protein n=1 Tax=Hanstruepera marina TaxID=2873265 RepID=UPI001CA682D5|nr:UvrD-helicase domain-containing protein [Hanstruepera marina]
MSEGNSFLIYNASAGSGKTFTLVKSYLSLLFQAKLPSHFKHILAITFTNKAAGEMKSRILEALTEFSSPSILESPTDLFNLIRDELHLSARNIHEKSKIILDEILHNYAAFDVSTIDGLTHKLIRTFAYDLKLPLNFEVELDTDRVLNEAVDRLISKAGTEKELTKLLVDFAIEKADDDKSWDISFDFNKIAKLLTNENDWAFLNSLKGKTSQDFKVFKKSIRIKIQDVEQNLVNTCRSALTLISECGLEFNDFLGGSRAYLPNYFLKLKDLNLEYDYDKTWVLKLEEKPLYPESKTPENIKAILDDVKPTLVDKFNETRNLFYLHKFLKSIYSNITPLSVLNEIQKEVTQLKTEESLLLISEFNTLISNEIKGQPTPFIYERLGEKFKHYFIDEFQDTSQLQWENLIPLLDNALSAENGTAMLVGDAKQAIYRWRGGQAEQFIDLFNKTKNPFPVEPKVISLASNFRSYHEIVTFNNGFFRFLSSSVFSNTYYQNLYTSIDQNIEKKHAGCVNLSFLDIDSNTEFDKNELYSKQVYEAILNCLGNGFELNDICVLVRKKKEGIAVSEYLSANDISIMSSETLLINNSPKIRFIIHVLQLITQPENIETKVEVLNFIANQNNITDKHTFFKKYLNIANPELFEALGHKTSIAYLSQLSLFELAETLIREFNLAPDSDAFVQYFMDVVLDFTRKKQADIISFLDYYESKKSQLSIVSPQGFNAVQIMTIHKSKGLEFPVVIFPYADLNIYQEKEPKEWFQLDSEQYNGFNYALLNYSKQFDHFGTKGQAIFNRHQSELELDNLNLLYVALTRPVEQLHIISKKDINSKGDVNPNTYAGFFISYLKELNLWDEAKLNYGFGTKKRKPSPLENVSSDLEELKYISVSKESHDIKIITNSGYLWDTAQGKAIEKGNLVHQIMSFIKTSDDVNLAISKFKDDKTYNISQITLLEPLVKSIVNHSKLAGYFTADYNVYNELDIISKSGKILRPDRLNINDKNEVVIIDYKSGQSDNKHISQLDDYKAVLTKMKYKVIKQILVYINDGIEVKEF